MKLAQKHSHINAEEYLIVHHAKIYDEIITIIKNIDALEFKTKLNEEKITNKNINYPDYLYNQFKNQLNSKGWNESIYEYYMTTDPKILEELIFIPFEKQKEFLINKGIQEPISSFK